MTLSPSAQKVQDSLRAGGFNNLVIEYLESTRTAQEAAERAGCSLGQIIKSLVFRARTSGKPILVLTSGANRVDESRLSKEAGEPIDRADAEFVRQVTGYAIGGVPPLGHTLALQSFIDEDLLQYPTLWGAAGTPNAMFELTPAELQKMTAGKTTRVKK